MRYLPECVLNCKSFAMLAPTGVVDIDLSFHSALLGHFFLSQQVLHKRTWSHTFLEIDYEILFTVIHLLPLIQEGCCQLQAKVCAQSTIAPDKAAYLRGASQNVPLSKRPLVKTSPNWSKRPQTRKKDWSKRPHKTSPIFKGVFSNKYGILAKKKFV